MTDRRQSILDAQIREWEQEFARLRIRIDADADARGAEERHRDLTALRDAVDDLRRNSRDAAAPTAVSEGDDAWRSITAGLDRLYDRLTASPTREPPAAVRTTPHD